MFNLNKLHKYYHLYFICLQPPRNDQVKTIDCVKSECNLLDDVAQQECFALIHFPFRDHLGLDKQYGISRRNHYWSDGSDDDNLKEGSKVIVKSYYGNNLLRFDRGIIIKISGKKFI